MSALALVDGRLVSIAPMLALPGALNGYLTVPTARDTKVEGQFVVQAGSTVIEAGVTFFTMKDTKRGSIVAAIDGRTGRYEARGIGSITLRAVVGGEHIDRELTIQGLVAGKDLA